MTSFRMNPIVRWPLCFTLLALLFPSPTPAAEIKKLDGTSLTGDVLTISATELHYQANGQAQTLPLKQIMGLDLGVAARPVPRSPYLRVRLIDGTQLYCLTLGMKAKTVDLTLLSGQSISLSLDAIHHIVCDAQDAGSLTAFDALLAESLKQDVIRVQSREGNTIDPYEGVIQGANETGNRLQFKAQALGTVSNIDLARLRGLYFARTNPGPGTQAISRIFDSYGNIYTATAFSLSETECQLTTQTGITLKLPRPTIQKFDLTLGKLAYLSDLEPSKIEETPILADLYHFRRDKNLEGGPLSVGRKFYVKGLALHSKAVLDYDVAGYATFRCVLGLDDAMAGPAHAVVKIEGDGKELLSTAVSSRDNKPQEVALAIAGVKTLRLIVDYGEDLDLGDHVDFADARVIK
jgi:hypothetical protein